MRLTIDELEYTVRELLLGAGLNMNNSLKVAKVYLRATLRNVGHHDINDLPKRLEALNKGLVNANPKITRTQNNFALENYNGDNGLGELCSSFIMDRAEELANLYGIGFCSIYNSNHFLSASPYVENSAEKGYFSIIWSSTQPVMGWPNSKERLIGNNPMGFGTPGKKHPILLDISMAYHSIGNLIAYEKKNKKIPKHTAVDISGHFTDDPSEAIKGASLPIGLHKGFGLAVLGELLTTVMNGGTMVKQKSEISQLFGHHMHAQTAIAIKPDIFMSMELFKERVNELQNFINQKDSGVRMPGERSRSSKKELEQNGIYIKEDLRNELNAWASKFNLSIRI